MLEQNNSTIVILDLQAAKAQLAQRCQAIAQKYHPEGVRFVRRKRLSGLACYLERELHAPLPITRKSLYIYLHECAHFNLNHQTRKIPRHAQEMEAEQYAHRIMREEGLSVPRAMTERAKAYVRRKVRQAIRHGAKKIDPRVRRYLA
jgi:hypothetical protein